jgi:hypothetical protein
MSALTYLPNRPDQVLAALRQGQIVALETATEQLPDLFLLYAIESGLLTGLSNSFPDPRCQQPEIDMSILLAAGLAGHFAGLYALSQSPYALHSPQLLAALGVQVLVNQPGAGLSRKGTKEAAPFHGDVIRKLLATLEKIDKAKKQRPGQSLLDWYNASVGHLFCEAVAAQPSLHILDCTDLEVRLDNDHYELSGITTKDKRPERGYKLATLRSVLDSGALITGIAWGAIQEHDLPLTKELIQTSAHLHPGDMLLEGRGFLDGATLTYLKKERGVDVCIGLKEDMNLLKAAIVQANAHPGSWQPHPSRQNQEIQLVEGLGGLWPELGVAVNVVVVRFRDKQEAPWDYVGFATTDLTLSAKQVILFYQTRPEIEEDYRQLKSASWRLSGFSATRLVQIIFHVVLTLLAYNLFQVFANTKAGAQFADKTKQKLEREMGRNPPTYLLVCTQDAFGVYETKSLLYILLDLPDEVRKKIRSLLPKRLE